jgi:hypothetical protein
MGWQDKKVQLPDSRIADGVVTINPTTGEPYSTATGGIPISVVGSSGFEATVNALEQLQVRSESTALFSEEFDTLDTVNRWTLRNSGGSVTAATGTLTVSGSATANAWGGLQTQPTFQSIGLNLIEFGGVFMFSNIAIANTKRFIGMGTIPTTPTLTTPITDGCGFELDGNGALWAVIYESGVRSPRSVNVTTLAGLANNTPVPLIVCRRADTLLFYVTNSKKPDATIPLPGLDLTALPLAFLAVNGSPAPASAPTFQCFGLGVGDTGCNASSIKDPVNPFWQAAVTKPNTPVAASQSGLAVGLHPSSPLPSGTNNIGSVGLKNQVLDCAGFSAVGASVLDQFFVQTPYVGTGVSYNQASGALNIVAGTTANAEFLARSVTAYRGSMRKRFTLTASQRIANNNLSVILADLIGENLAVTINSATSITVAVPGHTLTATNVGQFVNVGAINGAAGIPGRYAIASVVTGTSITLTVAGWPASGSCTATLFGRNYIRTVVNGTTATNVLMDAQRNGWATGDTAATVNTTASPGLLIQVETTGREIFFSDSLRASTTAPNFTTRASRYENIPEPDIDLYVFIWSANGSTAPASNTTWTIGSLAIESFPNVPVYIQGFRSTGFQNAVPTNVLGGSISTVSTVSTVSSVTGIGQAGTPTPPGTPYFVNSAASTNGALILTGTSGLQAFYASNIGASDAFVKLYNKATAPTVGTDVPEMVIRVPATGQVELTPGFNGYRFPLGLGIAITALAADTDTTAVAAGQVKVKLSRTA